MTVYFYTTRDTTAYQPNIMLIKAIQNAGALLHSNLVGVSYALEFPKGLDAVVVLGDPESQEASYVVALAIARRKPILYLLTKGELVPPDIQKISETHELKKVFKFSYFTLDTASKIIGEFIDQFVYHTDTYEIKFTLRLNTELERYLKWKSKRMKVDKATLVRRLIEEFRGHDEQYKG
ncbi:MAG: hypothetical protein UW39_C0027G0016 [Parcubacteria group bacterium GW2011_GWC2_44_17]|uniref:Ribbon-helix-helix protein CopG domain-containing protein n=1 Tax=Candidatus Jacksonbacteria bacterium RIFCSPLOWO2_02_FULL_44_20 TaxID=1798460 RepID=A0A1G2A6U4_9BACT|nr:MAG: hypothetical protein UW39_C0027G0016 [Parcubacteria group bacterium GW2011_GWC2_44_17]KKT50030.1 MAG: hypothetical protein UW40_C0011G0016 [Parcubacteria group bacterium GW2011_GWF2_44_17]OGY69401.1 MAG: hypothetical protein A3C00_04170 [Candidatus Jacksonbacteria bacterium RIFCSPHIGHO2_02_FULL_44_25]OGY72481.1 MAG: hypothetical protein A3H61_01075 [Candidatus Jacksonbacteria bacterium RIFCSPLOWO2_02_FULL_44_20]OGY72612.1 MAG: hypothetical protein A3E05_00215 [Candidatus Jacksonbacteria